MQHPRLLTGTKGQVIRRCGGHRAKARSCRCRRTCTWSLRKCCQSFSRSSSIKSKGSHKKRTKMSLYLPLTLWCFQIEARKNTIKNIVCIPYTQVVFRPMLIILITLIKVASVVNSAGGSITRAVRESKPPSAMALVGLRCALRRAGSWFWWGNCGEFTSWDMGPVPCGKYPLTTGTAPPKTHYEVW